MGSRPPTIEVINYSLNTPSFPHARPAMHADEFAEFVTGVTEPTEAAATDILVAFVYIQHARPYLSVKTEGWALHRISSDALIIASKYFNDSRQT